MSKWALAGLSLALIGPVAFAAETPVDHVTEMVTIAAPPAKVWSIVSNFADWSWHPAVKADSAPQGNAPGSVRTLDLGGPRLVEELASYDAGHMTYTYRITDDPNNVKTLPVTQYVSTLSVKPGPNNGSVVEWQGSFHRADPSANPAATGNDETAVKAVTGVYRLGLDNLKKVAEQGG